MDINKKILELESALKETKEKLEKAELYNRIFLFTMDRMYEGVSISFEEDNHIIRFYTKPNENHDIYNQKEVLGKTVGELWGSKEQEAAFYSQNPRLDQKLFYQRKSDGKECQMVFSTYPYYEYGKRIAHIAIRRDVTNINTFIMKTYELQKQLNHLSSGDKTFNNGTRYTLSSIIGESEAIKKDIELARCISRHSSNVLIYGETGTGKELFAQGIHNASTMCNEPFIAVNCSAIPGTLMESILFGTRKGSFTDAREKAGLFEQAGKGSIFLDEIDSMPKSMQVKLLRVLQEHTVRRIGDTKDRKICCRVISATNIAPIEAIKKDLIRRDLFYRLSAVILNIPPLRERKEDIPVLFDYFVKKYNTRFSKSIESSEESLQSAFENYDWPGNVREFEHMIESAMNFAEDGQKMLTMRYMPFLGNTPKNNRTFFQSDFIDINKYDTGDGIESIIKNIEKEIITRYVLKNKGNISATARALGISRESLYRKMKRVNLKVKKTLR